MPDSSRRARVVATAVAGLLLLQVAWVFALPPFRGIDEFDHAYRASSVAHGHWTNGGYGRDDVKVWGALIPVQGSVVRAAGPVCETYDYVERANCRPVSSLGGGMVLAGSAASNYNPVYYAVVGLPSLVLEGSHALYGMRAVALLLNTILLGLALWCTTLWARTRWPVVALLLCVTPMTVFSTVLPSPNGVEMSAALVLWVALIGLTRAEDRRTTSRLLGAAMIAAPPLLLARSIGPLWMVLILSLSLLQMRPVGWIASWRRARVHWIALAMVVLVCTAAGVAWTLAADTNKVPPPPQVSKGSPPGDSPQLAEFLQQPLLWVFQSVAAFPTRNEQAPGIVYAIELVILAAFLVLALRRGGNRGRWVWWLLLVAGFAVPAALTLLTYQSIGFAWQGRYTLPLTFGLVLLAGAALDSRAWRHRLAVPILTVMLGATAVAHAVAIVNVRVRESAISPLAGDPRWLEPSLWWLVPMALSGPLLWILTVRAAHTPTRAGATRATETMVAPTAS